jgi:DNA-binding beta-propeller fold protein YncE
MSPTNKFVCVQSVYIDANNFLWVLNAAAPQMRGVVPGGAKLLKFDVGTRQLVQRIDFNDPMVVYSTGYLNDVRIDTQNNVAYVTDSNAGAIIVVNLARGRARRLLGNHPSTKSEKRIITAEGQFQVVSQEAQLKWPNSFSVATDGSGYVTTSQLHIPRRERTKPYRIFKLAVPQ